MKSTQRELLKELLKGLDIIDYIQEDEIPDIPLYMDQVTTFMDSRLENATRKPGEDKILTKTMINNYAKNNLLPPSFKKKYSKDHILLMILIFYYKGFLSISDIQSFIGPLGERFFNPESEYDLSKIYKSVFDLQYGQAENLVKDIMRSFSKANNKFEDAPTEDQEFLQMFGFICTLSFEVYVKKLLIERVIDKYFKTSEEEEPIKEADEKDSKKDSKKEAKKEPKKESKKESKDEKKDEKKDEVKNNDKNEKKKDASSKVTTMEDISEEVLNRIQNEKNKRKV